MKTNDARLPTAALAAVIAALSSTIHAEEPPGFAQLQVADEAQLETMRGMDGDTHIAVATDQDLSAAVTGSSFDVGTMNGGSVTFAEHSLDNYSGIGLFNVVTGNNNAVNASVGVTFNLQ